MKPESKKSKKFCVDGAPLVSSSAALTTDLLIISSDMSMEINSVIPPTKQT
jgi:hypothetical protein